MTSVMAGLSSVEASRRLAADGPNQLPEPRRPSALRHLGKQFTHLLAILLWVASGLALLAGQPPLAGAIVVVIVLNAVFAFAQEYRADRSAERLRSLLPISARGTPGRPVEGHRRKPVGVWRPGRPSTRRPDQR
jgi:magnesium-transporting ATPase (P-type)